MSIDAEEFDKHKNPIKYVIAFLAAHRDKAYTVEHIAKEIGMSPFEVKSALFFDSLARTLDPRSGSPIESVTVGSISYYKYKGQ